MKDKQIFFEEYDYTCGEAAFLNSALIKQIVIKKEKPLGGSDVYFEVLGFFDRAKAVPVLGGERVFVDDVCLGKFKTFEEAKNAVEKNFTLKRLDNF